MGKITHTNIIIDQFSTARNNPFNKYVHFLTHIHTDHLKGLSNSWDCGTIYCSAITKQLLLLKFPRLKCLRELDLEKQHTITLSSQLEVTVTLFDSNHCAGGVMLLIQGYMGNVFYTGDMRFDKDIFGQFTYIYPHIKRNINFSACSKDIDFLYLDTTFLHPKFSFPPKQQALRQIDQFIQGVIQKAKQEKKFIQFYIGIDSFGKEEVLVHLAQKFQTLVTVSEQRYKYISTIGLQSSYFTTDPSAGFIHIVQKRQLKQHIAANQDSMGIILTGWANKAHYRSKKTYAIPYSLHSSYPQLVAFVDSMRPCFIESIIEQPSSIKPRATEQSNSHSCFPPNDQFSLYQDFSTYQYLNKLRNQLTSKPSAELLYLTSNVDFQKKIRQKLRLDRTSVQINREQFGMTTAVLRVENVSRAGVKLNGHRNEEQIQKVKQKLRNKQQSLKLSTLNQYHTKKALRQAKRQLNKSSQNSPFQIEGSSGEQIKNIHNQQKQSSSKNNSNESKKQNDKLKNQPLQIQLDSQLTRKNKWKNKMQEGQIDLFGRIPTKQTQNISCNNENDNSNTFGKPKKITKKKKVYSNKDSAEWSDQVQILDKKQFQSFTKNKLQKKMQENNMQKGLSNIRKQQGYLYLPIPTQKEPNQRTIFDFFCKSSSNSIATKHNSWPTRQPQPAILTSSNEADDQEQASQIELYTNLQQKQFKDKKIIRNCKDCSIFQIDYTYLDQIKEASIQSYESFFINRNV